MAAKMAIGLNGNEQMNLQELQQEFNTNFSEHDLNARVVAFTQVELSAGNPQLAALKIAEHSCDTYEYSTITATCLVGAAGKL